MMFLYTAPEEEGDESPPEDADSSTTDPWPGVIPPVPPLPRPGVIPPVPPLPRPEVIPPVPPLTPVAA